MLLRGIWHYSRLEVGPDRAQYQCAALGAQADQGDVQAAAVPISAPIVHSMVAIT